MYVCMYRSRPLWNFPLLRAIQLGLGEGAIGIVGPLSQPSGTIHTASLTLYHTHALNVCFLKQLYSRLGVIMFPIKDCKINSSFAEQLA